MGSAPPYHHLTKDLAGHAVDLPALEECVIEAFDPLHEAQAVHGMIAAAYADAGDDFPAFEAWWNALVADEEYEPEIIFVARARDGAICGVAHCWSSGFVKDLAVAPAFRRRGIGRALMLHAFAHFASAGHRGVELKVSLTNATGAERLYRSLGMVEVES